MATRKKTTTAAGTKATAVLQLLDIREPWVAVWFDIDDDGDFRDSVVTERLVCWALTADGSVVGVAPASPSDEAAGLYLPELVDKNFQGLLPRGERRKVPARVGRRAERWRRR